MIFWTKQQKYSKSDDFARVCAIINHDLFWCQKLSKSNLRMTLGLIFNHLFWKHHFGAFSVFYTKYSSIFGDKKIQTQKWCIVEKFRPQKLGVTKGFFILKVVSDFDFDHFLEKWSQHHLWPNISKTIQPCGQLSNVHRYQKHIRLVQQVFLESLTCSSQQWMRRWRETNPKAKEKPKLKHLKILYTF